jgi:ATP adenylyltransferase
MLEGQSNARETLLLKPGTLWEKAIAQTEYALKCGALHPIETECRFVEQSGINFVVRVLPNLARKDAAKKQQEKKTATSGKEFNPFLPYEEDLFVADISETHLCLLNKYNAIDYHLLIVTRAFEEQEELLNLRDFEAMWACLAEIDGLAFYNGGKIAGSSQRHKHLQLVPLPFAPNSPKVPIEPAIASAVFQGSIGTIPSFPFVHAIAKFNPNFEQSPREAASHSLELYHTLLRAVSLLDGDEVTDSQQKAAYNLIVTRSWMLLVPRSQEDFESIPVNSLGFTGALLVRSEQQMQLLIDKGPIAILKGVAIPTAP